MRSRPRPPEDSRNEESEEASLTRLPSIEKHLRGRSSRRKQLHRPFLQRQEKREEVALGQHENLYGHQVRHFNAAVQGKGTPFATGEDGVRSLAVAAAVLESTKTGQRTAVRY